MRRSFVWAGRASRSELWWFVLIVWIVTWALGALATGQGLWALGLVSSAVSLLTLPAWLAVMVRRLHDRDHSAAWLVASAVLGAGGVIGLAAAGLLDTPLDELSLAGLGGPSAVLAVVMGVALAAGMVLWLVLLVWWVLPGTPGANRYGAPPGR